MSGPLSEHNKLAVPTGVNWKVLTAAFLPRVMFRGGHSCRARLFLEDGKLLENLERMRHTDSSRSSIPRPMHGMHLGCGIRYAFYSSHISVLPSSLVLGISHTRMPVRVRVWWSVDCGFGSHRHTLHLGDQGASYTDISGCSARIQGRDLPHSLTIVDTFSPNSLFITRMSSVFDSLLLCGISRSQCCRFILFYLLSKRDEAWLASPRGPLSLYCNVTSNWFPKQHM